jgi:hypothetical protein
MVCCCSHAQKGRSNHALVHNTPGRSLAQLHSHTMAQYRVFLTGLPRHDGSRCVFEVGGECAAGKRLYTLQAMLQA